MKIDLAPDEIDSRLYDRDNGDGVAQAAIDNLRMSKCSNEDKDVKLSDVCDTLKNQAKKSVVDEDENRVAILLRAAKELLIKQRDFGILMDFPLTVHYDDADCA